MQTSWIQLVSGYPSKIRQWEIKLRVELSQKKKNRKICLQNYVLDPPTCSSTLLMLSRLDITAVWITCFDLDFVRFDREKMILETYWLPQISRHWFYRSNIHANPNTMYLVSNFHFNLHCRCHCVGVVDSYETLSTTTISPPTTITVNLVFSAIQSIELLQKLNSLLLSTVISSFVHNAYMLNSDCIHTTGS